MSVKSVKQREGSARQEGMGSATVFTCDVNPAAKEVYLVGEFNSWNIRADRMTKTKDGFRKTLKLPPGEYQYKFLIDGVWHHDPSAAKQVHNAFGTTNSVVRVRDTSDR